MINAKISRFCFLVSLFLILQSKKLVMIHEIFRHGARYPYSPMKADFSDYTSQENLRGELTLQGKHMQYLLGKIIYEKYWDQLFAGTQFANKYHPSQIYVKSTNVNRTIQSAESQLLGLFEKLPAAQLPVSEVQNSLPAFQNAQSYQQNDQNSSSFKVYGGTNTFFHLAPIHQVQELEARSGYRYKYRANPYDEGDFLAKYDQENCPNQQLWMRENRASQKAMKIKNSDQVKAYLDTLSKAVGQNVKFQEAIHYYDDYICAKFLSKDHLKLFEDPATFKVADFVALTSTIFNSFYTQTQIKTVNTRILQAIVNNMKQAIIKKGPRMVLYSAHDTTILSFGTALNFTNIGCLMEYFYEGKSNKDVCITDYPPFSTNYIIQLWQQDNFSHSIKILYNGVQRKIPVCGYQYSCSFADFEKWAENFYVDDPNDICGIREQYLKLYIVIAVLSVFLVIFIIVQMRSKMKKKLQKHLHQMEQRKGYLENFEEKEGEFPSQKHNQDKP